MPEGPSLVILREDTARFVGQEIVEAGGNTTAIDPGRLVGQTLVSLRTWGKHFLIVLPNMVVRIHFLLFGTYRVNERRDKPPRLFLRMADGGEINFYACSVREIEGELDSLYDWQADVMSEAWNPRRALKKLRARPDLLACDALLDQDIFSGVGNIIKNEVLFRIRVHPASTVGALPAPKLRALVEQARQYSFEFLAWKKEYVLKQHWLAHAKKICPRCNIPFHKAHLGRTNRRSFFCERCQKRYT
ncbi:endonuclease [Massilia sp. Dwa41.01b]|uniref:DNA-formamidopyrimidine glycosylase family protein n=1 Tax=unclassified Massilia TaxID=2609279 RepID=UPI001600FD6E|nr:MULTISPECIES: DNA-formamidopyrimidine glycosylase family protein [unclassified Massilia]QNA87733.1 endonuclease [Massilia sp. Dwa41.01b]QNA98632.1 endonuclease [Massilia sp. Se16.2.3]